MSSSRKKLALVGVGLAIGLLLLETGLRLGGAWYAWRLERANRATLADGGTVRIVCLGESTTAFGGPHAYPRLLEKVLNARGDRVTYSVINKGVPATNTDAILASLDGILAEYRPHIVVAMMGVNDEASEPDVTGGGVPLRSVELFRQLWRTLGGSADLVEVPLEERRRRASEALARNPDDADALFEMSRVHVQDRKWRDAASELERVIELDPHHLEARHQLASVYALLRRPEDSRAVLEAAVASGDADAATAHLLTATYFTLTTAYVRDGRRAEAEALLEEATRSPFEEVRAFGHGRLALLYQSDGNRSLFESHLRRAKVTTWKPRTRRNYLELERRLAARGIPLVAVQYPMRSAEALRRLFEGHENVVLVDNEALFREALESASYREYFTDEVGGDFGHMTEQGHWLLARNVARAIEPPR